MKKSVKKKILIALGVIALCATAYWAYASFIKEDKKDAALLDIVMPVEKGTIEQVITSQGKLEPKEYVDVGAQVSGQLEKLHVDIGDTIEKGALIAEIDPSIYLARVEADEARLKTLRAQLNEQEAQIDFARLQFERNTRLLKAKAVSKQVLETSDTDLKIAKARAESLKAQIQEAESTLSGDKANLNFTKIYAPISGTVVVLTSREGQTLNANQTAPVIVQLANLDTMTVRAQVAEADVLNLRENMDVYFTILGNLNRKWNGKVRQVLPSPEVVNEVVLYNVLVDVDNSDRILMTGMTTQMFFIQGEARDVPVIPSTALRRAVPDQNSDMGEAYVVYAPNGRKDKPLEKTVFVGLMNRNMAEIKDGLALGDSILVPATSADAAKAGGGGGRRFMGGPRL